jgi:hypothetical protein
MALVQHSPELRMCLNNTFLVRRFCTKAMGPPRASCVKWSHLGDSNPGPPLYESGALAS